MSKLIIFDMDGTLVNSRDFVFKALKEVAPEFGFPTPTDETFNRLRDAKSIEYMRVLGLPIWKAPALIRRVQYMMSHDIEHMNLVEDMGDVLLRIKQEGHRLVVFTSNTEKNLNLFLKKYDGEYFDTRIAGVLPFTKGFKLKKLLKKEGFAKEDAVYIGDETRDIRAAEHANVCAIGVTWGFNSEAILSSMEPNFIARTPTDILHFLEIDV